VFGAPPKEHATKDLPQHGFARAVRWEYLGKNSSESTVARGAADSAVKLDFLLDSSALPDKFKKAWPYDFGLTYSVTLSPEGLQTMLSVQNNGASFDFQVLMHTYLHVDVRHALCPGFG
jgi:glucose-6-phosphate 1-epimerase